METVVAETVAEKETEPCSEEQGGDSSGQFFLTVSIP